MPLQLDLGQATRNFGLVMPELPKGIAGVSLFIIASAGPDSDDTYKTLYDSMRRLEVAARHTLVTSERAALPRAFG